MPRDCSLCTQQGDYGCGVSDFTEVRFASFLSSGFSNMAVINPPEKKLALCISVHQGTHTKKESYKLTVILANCYWMSFCNV